VPFSRGADCAASEVRTEPRCVCYEVGQDVVEADATSLKRSDFLEYYGREMLRLASRKSWCPARRAHYLVYIPLGVA